MRLNHLQSLCWTVLIASLNIHLAAPTSPALERVAYNHPGLVVDLGVGLWAWPMPMDWDGDGDYDLIVSCPDVPFNGTYFFENPGQPDVTSGDPVDPMPVFRPGVRVGPGMHSIQVSYVNNQPRVLTPATEWTNFLGSKFEQSTTIYPRANVHVPDHKIRANQWRYVDYDGDGAVDIVVGVGDWEDYGWDNAFDDQGQWTRGPLHGYVYWIRNVGTTDAPRYGEPQQVMCGETPVDVFGMPSPNFADFDGDDDLDLLCGEFLDGFTYFENVGNRVAPRYAPGRRLKAMDQPLAMELQMITPTAIDWDRDGDMDLVVGDEDGRVAWVEHTGAMADGLPQFRMPQYFRQEAADLKFGALATPVSVDWDRDGDEDLVCGNTAGFIGLIENLDGGNPPRWAAPRRFLADGRPIRIQAGSNGSIQGPAEAKWGYTTLSVADWNDDGHWDLIVNSIWGRVMWYAGSEGNDIAMSSPRPVRVASDSPLAKPVWNWWSPDPGTLITQWRTTPLVADWDRDGQLDLIMLDHEGYLAFYQGTTITNDQGHQEPAVHPPQRLFFDPQGNPIRLNDGVAGRSGRRKLCLADWDNDGRLDLMVNSTNANWFRQLDRPGPGWTFRDRGPVAEHRLAGHTTSPTPVDWDRDGKAALLIGAEDGHFYQIENPDAVRGSSLDMGQNRRY